MGSRARATLFVIGLVALAAGAQASGPVPSTVDAKRTAPAPNAIDVFGVEPGMSLVEVRQALERRFPSAFSGCAAQIEAPRPLVCRVTPDAYYEEVVGRPLSSSVSAESPYVSNLVLTVTESDAKRSIEVYFGSSASGREAYRISGITHYEPRSQPSVASFEAAFADKYGAPGPSIARGRGTVAASYFADGQRIGPAPGCQDLAAQATQLHDVRAMADRGFSRQLRDLPCDMMITLSLAPGTTPAHVGISTVQVFDAARLARLFDRETQAAAAANAALQNQPGPQPRRTKDF